MRQFYPKASHWAKHEPGKMNKTEKAFSEILEKWKLAGEILEWAFEPEKFRLADNTFYTPDFRVIMANETVVFYEVKGSLTFIEDDAMVKIKVCAEVNPYPFFLAAPKKKREGSGWVIKEVGNAKGKTGQP
jgi:hypothetical protein